MIGIILPDYFVVYFYFFFGGFEQLPVLTHVLRDNLCFPLKSVQDILIDYHHIEGVDKAVPGVEEKRLLDKPVPPLVVELAKILTILNRYVTVLSA